MTAQTQPEPTITTVYDKAPDGTYTATLTVHNLATEQLALGAVLHMERLFCGEEVITKELQ